MVNAPSELLCKGDYVMVNFKYKPPENQQCGENDIKWVRVAFQVESNHMQVKTRVSKDTEPPQTE